MIAGEGGDDAKLFAQQLFDAYLMYAANEKVTTEIEEDGPGKWSLLSQSQKAFDLFSNEAGGHCVQRMPANGKGHKHTSYAAVMVTRLLTRYTKMNESDLEESFQRGHGRGGQNVNKVNSAVRLKHRPSGLEVFINGRDQGHNRQTARHALASKIDRLAKTQQTRADYAGAGRGEKIRTYNIQDSRVTDHRNGAKCHRPDLILKEGRFELLR